MDGTDSLSKSHVLVNDENKEHYKIYKESISLL